MLLCVDDATTYSVEKFMQESITENVESSTADVLYPSSDAAAG